MKTYTLKKERNDHQVQGVHSPSSHKLPPLSPSWKKNPEETQAVYVPEVFPAKEKKQSITQKTKSSWTSWQKRERNMGKQIDELVEGSREGTVGKSCNIDNVT